MNIIHHSESKCVTKDATLHLSTLWFSYPSLKIPSKGVYDHSDHHKSKFIY